MSLPLALVLVTLWTVIGGVADAQAERGDLFSGVSVTCSARVPSFTTGCFAERRIVTLGPLGVSFGVDALVVLSDFEEGHLAPYGLVTWYEDSWGAWLEVRLPRASGVPVLGAPDWLRVGFTYTVP